jgi:hypothetical protein
VPIISCTIDPEHPHLLRDDYRAFDPAFWVEVMTVLCLSGPAAEEYFVGAFDDDADKGDIMQAREILARQYGPLQIGFALTRYKDAADRLVRTEWAQQRIPLIANALLQRGTLTADEIGVIISAAA